MRIAFVASEAVPYAKTGGLADVAGALTKVLARRGHDVALFLPLYAGVDRKALKAEHPEARLTVTVGTREEKLQILSTTSGGVTVHFVCHDGFFLRPELYRDPATGLDWADNDRRFVFFSRAVLEICRQRHWYPEIVHANDWQSAPVLALLATHYREQAEWRNTGTLFTVHNIAYQGLFPEKTFDLFSVGREWWYPGGPFEYWGKVNFLKLGLEFADAISTVSPRYAREIAESNEFGFGMEGILQRRHEDLFGVTNGIDYEEWNPAADPLIPAPFSAGDLSGKAVCKSRLRAEVGLPESKVPLIGIVSRLADQKGFDLIEKAAGELLSRPLQMVILGTGDKKYHTLLKELADSHPDRLRVRLGFDNGLAHRIEAGCDMFLMPSRYEPCGLNQMYSLRYGTIPVVRATGGLADTVLPYASGTGTGFQFDAYDEVAMMEAIDSALAVYRQPKAWRQLILRAMAADFSWDAAAQAYERLYATARVRPRRLPARPAVH
jgi:starch synthase